MAGSVVHLHAPDGATGVLCQARGDVTTFIDDMDCGDCLYILDKNPIPWNRLAYQLSQLRGLS